MSAAAGSEAAEGRPHATWHPFPAPIRRSCAALPSRPSGAGRKESTCQASCQASVPTASAWCCHAHRFQGRGAGVQPPVVRGGCAGGRRGEQRAGSRHPSPPRLLAYPVGNMLHLSFCWRCSGLQPKAQTPARYPAFTEALPSSLQQAKVTRSVRVCCRSLSPSHWPPLAALHCMALHRTEMHFTALHCRGQRFTL